MWFIIAKKEIRNAFQNKVLLFLTAIIWVLLLLAALGGLKFFNNISSQQNTASELFKKQLAERDRNPHAAAHFGTYLFKPLTPLSLYDPGVNNYTGSTFRIEAHKQSEMNLAAARDSEGMMRFGELSVASVFQLFVPLMIVFLCFASISKEREDGNLKLLFAQGLSRRALLWGKIWGNYGIVIFAVLPAFLFILVRGSITEILPMVILFVISYTFYFFVYTCIAVGISYVTRTSGTSLLILLCVWIWVGVISPKLIAGVASTIYPLPSYYQFSKLTSNDFYNGIDQDGTYAQRREKLEKNVLSRYKVDSAAQLPVNLDGLMMQDGEDYNSRIYRLRSAPVEQQMERQKNIFGIASFFSPYITIKQLSMGFAGTDLYRHQDFHRQGGRYRDDFIRTLNMELAKENHKDGHYVVSTAFLDGMKQFHYRQPSIGKVMQNVKTPIISLLYWLFIIILLLEVAVRKNIAQ
jgi:ABC-2 type transport system permease protein